MAEAIRYRGLDAEARWTDNECVSLFHCRLSIIDLEGGHQPMQDSSGRYMITYNGEVYNYLELREEYEDLGSRFQTDSDTEVIVEGFRHKGENVLDDLNGMFAFATVKPGDLQPCITRYWRASYGSKTRASLDRHIEDYEAILTDAIAIRLRSDVPLAITFSGGCDSGTIAAIAKKKLDADLHCYTLDYHTTDEPSEEVTRAERVAKILELDCLT